MQTDKRLGLELLEKLFEITQDSQQLKKYYKILKMPGAETALYALCEDDETYQCSLKTLAQSCFLLGCYLSQSLHESERLWTAGDQDNEG